MDKLAFPLAEMGLISLGLLNAPATASPGLLGALQRRSGIGEPLSIEPVPNDVPVRSWTSIDQSSLAGNGPNILRHVQPTNESISADQALADQAVTDQLLADQLLANQESMEQSLVDQEIDLVDQDNEYAEIVDDTFQSDPADASVLTQPVDQAIDLVSQDESYDEVINDSYRSVDSDAFADELDALLDGIEHDGASVILPQDRAIISNFVAPQQEDAAEPEYPLWRRFIADQIRGLTPTETINVISTISSLGYSGYQRWVEARWAKKEIDNPDNPTS